MARREDGQEYISAFHRAEAENRLKLGVTKCENQYSPAMLVALKEMASASVYPDGTFGDMDVAIWELFRW